MSDLTDYQILMSKFYNFKAFIQDVATHKLALKDYDNMTDNEFLLFGLGFLLPNKSKLQIIQVQIASKLGITNSEHLEKIMRYLHCFCEYLEQLNSKETVQACILNVAAEQNITIPPPPCGNTK